MVCCRRMVWTFEKMVILSLKGVLCYLQMFAHAVLCRIYVALLSFVESALVKRAVKCGLSAIPSFAGFFGKPVAVRINCRAYLRRLEMKP